MPVRLIDPRDEAAVLLGRAVASATEDALLDDAEAALAESLTRRPESLLVEARA